LGEYLQKAEKRRWIFRKLTSPTKQCEASMSGNGKCEDAASMDKQQRAIAAAKASTEAAQVAVKIAQAAVRSVAQTRIACLVKQHYAALVIQTAFRGYLVSSFMVSCFFVHFSIQCSSFTFWITEKVNFGQSFSIYSMTDQSKM